MSSKQWEGCKMYGVARLEDKDGDAIFQTMHLDVAATRQ